MMRIGIIGYGNLGQGVEAALRHSADMQLAAVFTRRDPASIRIRAEGVPVLRYDALDSMQNDIDVMILCGGSARDLPQLAPEIAARFNMVDSFDTHAKIPAHFAAVNAAAQAGDTVAVIAAGWDPGLFSLARLYSEAVLPQGSAYTFWGRGVSQGHSDAIRGIPGVADAIQYTVPMPEAMVRVRAGAQPCLTPGDRHLRECYVVPEDGADRDAIETAIKTMPNYFADYPTAVTFVTREIMSRDHGGMPHGGSVIRNGTTGWDGEHRQIIEYRLGLQSNPEFTAGVLVACARAVYRLAQEGATGCRTVLDLPPAMLSPRRAEALRAQLL